jgi:hypothetical protein
MIFRALNTLPRNVAAVAFLLSFAFGMVFQWIAPGPSSVATQMAPAPYYEPAQSPGHENIKRNSVPFRDILDITSKRYREWRDRK